MKNNILTIVAIVALFSLSFDKVTSMLTNRSKQQIIVHGTDVKSVVNNVNEMYSKGFRVTSIVSQSVSSGSYGDHNNYPPMKGEIIVTMEK